MTVTDTAVEFDPFSDDYFNDPTEIYRRLRDEAPVYFSEKYGFYALSRFADVRRRAPRLAGLLERARRRPLDALEGPRGRSRGFRSIIMMDPPEHDRLPGAGQPGVHPAGRRPPSSRWSARSITRLPRRRSTTRDDVRRRRRLLGAVPGRDHLAHARRARGRAPADPRTGSTSACTASRARWTRRPRACEAHARGRRLLLRARRGEARATRPTTCCRGSPRSPSTGATAARPASTTRRSPASPALLGGAGAETVTKLVGNAVVLFCQHPDQWQQVRRRPRRRSRGAVEEILRYLPPSQYQGRFCVRGPRVRGRHRSRPGFPVLLHHRARRRATRARFERPDDFDIERPPGRRHRLRPRRAQLPRRRAGPHGEPHRHRGAGEAVAAARGRRGRPAPGPHVERGRLLQRPGHRGALIRRPAAAPSRRRGRGSWSARGTRGCRTATG